MHCWLQYFREKIKAEAEGRPYTAPAPSKATSGSARPAAAAGGMTRNSRSFGKSGWDDWGDGPSGAGRPAKVCALQHPTQLVNAARQESFGHAFHLDGGNTAAATCAGSGSGLNSQGLDALTVFHKCEI